MEEKIHIPNRLFQKSSCRIEKKEFAVPIRNLATTLKVEFKKQPLVSPRYSKLVLSTYESMSFENTGFSSPRIVRPIHAIGFHSSFRKSIRKEPLSKSIIYIKNRPVPSNFFLDSLKK